MPAGPQHKGAEEADKERGVDFVVGLARSGSGIRSATAAAATRQTATGSALAARERPSRTAMAVPRGTAPKSR